MKHLFTLAFVVFLAGAFSSCIGTDVIDDLADEGVPALPTDSTATERSGTLQGRGGYAAAGTVTLSQNDEGDLVLRTSDDFAVTLALGTFLYLSNSELGNETAANGLEVADVSENLSGARTFNVTQRDASVALDTYQYVIVLCKPARITFGAAELN